MSEANRFFFYFSRAKKKMIYTDFYGNSKILFINTFYFSKYIYVNNEE